MALRFFLSYFIFTSCLVAGQPPIYALTGQQVKLNPAITGRPDEILWKHNGDKVVEFDSMEEKVYGTYQNRITLDWHSADLYITDLRFEDGGEYDLEIYVNKKLSFLQYVLEVIDEVPEPTITCQINDGSSSNTSGTLKCTAESTHPKPLTKFEWSSNGKVRRVPNLIIPLGDKHDDEVYSCRVSNPLTEKTATFTAKTCHPDKSLGSVIIGILVGVAILFLIGGIIFCKLKRKACFAEGNVNDVEKQKEGSGGTSHSERAHTHPSDERDPLLRNNEEGNNPQNERAFNFQKTRDFFNQKRDGQPPGPKTIGKKHFQNIKLEEKELKQNDDPLSEKADESEPLAADVSADLSEDKVPQDQEDQESSTVAERPGLETNKEGLEGAVSPSSTSTEPPFQLHRNNLATSNDGDADEDPQSSNGGDGQESSSTAEQPGVEKKKDELEKPAPLPSQPDPNDVSSKDKADADEDQNSKPEEKEVPQNGDSDSEKADEPEPPAADESADRSEDKMSDQESSSAAEQPVCVKVRIDQIEQNIKQDIPRKQKGVEKKKDELEKPAPLPSQPHPNDVSSKDKADADEDQNSKPEEKEVPQNGDSDSEKADEPEPPAVDESAERSEDKMSDQESSSAAEQPELEKKAKEDKEEESPPENGVSPTAQPHVPLTQNSPNMAPKETTVDTDLDHVNGETATQAPESGVLDTGETTEPQETKTSEDNQQGMGKPVSTAEIESVQSTSVKEKDEEEDLYLAASQQPQSHTPTKPDTTNTSEEAADQGKTSHESGESDESRGEPIEDKNEVHCGPKEEKPVSLSEDKEGQKKGEVVA